MASKPQDLTCWRLADQLRAEVHAICAQPQVAARRRFCDGFAEAAGSVCRNISEGFARFEAAPIVQFFTYALGSLGEVVDYLHECRTRGFIEPARFQNAVDLAEHTRATTLNFMRYHQRRLSRMSRPSGRQHRRVRR